MTAEQLKRDSELVGLLRGAIEAASDDDGLAPLSSIGNIITNRRPDFDSRSWGYAKLSDLIKATALFSIERHAPAGAKQAIVYAREKRRPPVARTAVAKAPAAKAPGAKPGTRRTTAKPATVKVVS